MCFVCVRVCIFGGHHLWTICTCTALLISHFSFFISDFFALFLLVYQIFKHQIVGGIGFGGLMLGQSQESLRLTRPTVPDRTDGLRFKGLACLGGVFDYEYNSSSISLSPQPGAVKLVLCLVDAAGIRHEIQEGTTTLQLADLHWPTQLGVC